MDSLPSESFFFIWFPLSLFPEPQHEPCRGYARHIDTQADHYRRAGQVEVVAEHGVQHHGRQYADETAGEVLPIVHPKRTEEEAENVVREVGDTQYQRDEEKVVTVVLVDFADAFVLF